MTQWVHTGGWNYPDIKYITASANSNSSITTGASTVSMGTSGSFTTPTPFDPYGYWDNVNGWFVCPNFTGGTQTVPLSISLKVTNVSAGTQTNVVIYIYGGSTTPSGIVASSAAYTSTNNTTSTFTWTPNVSMTATYKYVIKMTRDNNNGSVFVVGADANTYWTIGRWT